MSMLCLRATPVDPQLPSPAELLYQRKLESNLPTKIGNQAPDRDKIAQLLMERQQLTKHYHDRSAHGLIPLTVGQPVHIQDRTTKKWFPGIMSNRRPEPRPYDVQTHSDSLLRRNRGHLRPVNTGQVATGSEDVPSELESDDPPIKVSSDVPESTNAPHSITFDPVRDRGVSSGGPDTSQDPKTYRTRSGRAVIRPVRFME